MIRQDLTFPTVHFIDCDLHFTLAILKKYMAGSENPFIQKTKQNKRQYSRTKIPSVLLEKNRDGECDTE